MNWREHFEGPGFGPHDRPEGGPGGEEEAAVAVLGVVAREAAAEVEGRVGSAGREAGRTSTCRPPTTRSPGSRAGCPTTGSAT